MSGSQAGQALPGAGWYTDPDDSTQERWWDGAQWTEHQRARLAVAPAAPQPSPPPFAQSSLPRSGTQSGSARAAIGFGIVALVLLVVGLGLLFVGGYVAALNWLLILGAFLLILAVLFGIVALVLAIVVAARRR